MQKRVENMPIFNAFSEVTSVTERSPAQVSGLRSGDFLVKCQDELVIFQSHEDIENSLKQNDDLSLNESFSFFLPNFSHFDIF